MTAPQLDSARLELVPPSTPGTVHSIDLAIQIKAAFATSRAAVDSATDQARVAIAAAVECGDLLTRQKASLPHGAWMEWMTQTCPEISCETARRYMRLAKRSALTDLTEASNLHRAYFAAGVLPASSRKPREPDANTPIIQFTRGLDQFRRWYHRRTDEVPVEKWTPRARRILRNELTWFKNLYDRLAECPPHVSQGAVHNLPRQDHRHAA